MSIGALLSGFLIANGGPVAVAVLASQIVARAIPDDKKGALGVIRTVAKVAGIYLNVDDRKVAAKAADNAEAIAELQQTVVIRSSNGRIIPTKKG